MLASSARLTKPRKLWDESSARYKPAGRSRWKRDLALEREHQQLLFESEDAKEGLAAYIEKRPAKFKAK